MSSIDIEAVRGEPVRYWHNNRDTVQVALERGDSKVQRNASYAIVKAAKKDGLGRISPEFSDLLHKRLQSTDQIVRTNVAGGVAALLIYYDFDVSRNLFGPDHGIVDEMVECGQTYDQGLGLNAMIALTMLEICYPQKVRNPEVVTLAKNHLTGGSTKQQKLKATYAGILLANMAYDDPTLLKPIERDFRRMLDMTVDDRLFAALSYCLGKLADANLIPKEEVTQTIAEIDKLVWFAKDDSRHPEYRALVIETLASFYHQWPSQVPTNLLVSLLEDIGSTQSERPKVLNTPISRLYTLLPDEAFDTGLDITPDEKYTKDLGVLELDDSGIIKNAGDLIIGNLRLIVVNGGKNIHAKLND